MRVGLSLEHYIACRCHVLWCACACAVKSQESFYTIVELPEGEHQYKFLVDGSWKHSDHVPTVDNKMGSLNNLVVVHASDFEVRFRPACDTLLPYPYAPDARTGVPRARRRHGRRRTDYRPDAAAHVQLGAAERNETHVTCVSATAHWLLSIAHTRQ